MGKVGCFPIVQQTTLHEVKKGLKERVFIQRAKEQVQLEEWLHEQFEGAKVGEIEIHHTPLGMRVVVHTVSPGLVIGPGGEKIREVTSSLQQKFSVQNPQIDVQKIAKPDLDPQIVSQGMAEALERGMNFKRIGNFYLERIMRAGAIGCEIVLSGKLSGEKSRRERFIAGYLKKCGDPARKDVIRGFATASPPLGAIGVLTKIMIRHSDKKIIVPKPSADAVVQAQPKEEERAEKKPRKKSKKKAEVQTESQAPAKEAGLETSKALPDAAPAEQGGTA